MHLTIDAKTITYIRLCGETVIIALADGGSIEIKGDRSWFEQHLDEARYQEAQKLEQARLPARPPEEDELIPF